MTFFVAFGVGSMIYSGLEFAQYFEIDAGSYCDNILMAVTPGELGFFFLAGIIQFVWYLSCVIN
jgi:hypothetical protein